MPVSEIYEVQKRFKNIMPPLVEKAHWHRKTHNKSNN
jgi:hypothetical protein